ncbi:MAG: hypothetical protein JNL01_05700 [Bdellovibrionales bacterium]|nr:hypothetical protein [Bdellovibrionales bacterium]
MKLSIKKQNPLLWVFEPLESDPTFATRKMFGGITAFIDGRMVLVLMVSDEPWNGILVPTSREHHPFLMEKFKGLQSHPILGKWLYISQSDADFESMAESLTRAILKRVKEIGIEPGVRRRKKKEAKELVTKVRKMISKRR